MMEEIKQMSEAGLQYGEIYGLFHPITNELRYIGQTIVGLKKRLGKHISDSTRTLRPANTHVACWVRSLLKENLAPEIRQIERCLHSDLDNKEILYISYYKSLKVDLTNSELGGQRNRIMSQQTKDKISTTLRGRIQSEATKNKRSTTSKKSWNNPELKELKRVQTNELISKGIITCNKGRTTKKKGQPFAGNREELSKSLKKYFTEEVKNNLAIKRGRKPFIVYKATMIAPANRFRKKSVIDIGEVVLEHINLKAACDILGVNRINALRSLSGKRGIVQGYIFKYKVA